MSSQLLDCAEQDGATGPLAILVQPPPPPRCGFLGMRM